MKKISLEQVVGIIKKGFDELSREIFDMKKDISELKQGQEDILIKLDNYAYRFEVKELKHRADIIEKEIGL